MLKLLKMKHSEKLRLSTVRVMTVQITGKSSAKQNDADLILGPHLGHFYPVEK